MNSCKRVFRSRICNFPRIRTPLCFASFCSYSINPGCSGEFQNASEELLKSRGLIHRYKNWEEQRRWRLTASTFAGSLGFYPRRRVELWMEKVGLRNTFPGYPCLATCWNNLHEPEALERYQLITGNQVDLTGFHIHSCQWLGASPDGLINRDTYGDLTEPGVLEIKCPYLEGNAAAASPWYMIPACYIPQAQGLMEILDRDWVDFYVWTPNGSSLFRIERDRDYWQLIMTALNDFWFIHVEPARISRVIRPSQSLRRFMPKLRHRLFALIMRKSEHLARRSSLLVREVHGKIQH